MTIPLSGATQSNGSPKTFYEYSLSSSNRTASSVKVTLQIRLRLKNYSSYFSFRIAHECKVNGTYQYADIKTTRRFWGHQWSGSYYGGGDFYWQYGDSLYDGSAWKGWFTVFNGTVSIGTDDGQLHIVPCITRPPITGLGGGGIYAANAQDINNWQGAQGYWRPWNADEHIGTYAWRTCPNDGCFLNNRNLEELAGGWIGVYPRPASPSQVTASPTEIEIIRASDQRVTVSWDRCNGASRYDIFVYRGDSVPSGATVGDNVAQYATLLQSVNGIDTLTADVDPSLAFDIQTDDKLYFGVRTWDGQAFSKAVTWSNSIHYFEIPSVAPEELYCVGRRGTRNEVLCAGETVKFYYSGWFDGSYPLSRFELVGDLDGLVKSWNASDAIDSGVNGEKYVEVTLGRQRPRTIQVFTLKAYDTKNRLIYNSDGENTTCSVEYYGGIIWRYDVPNENRWHQGLTYIYKDGKWHETEGVYVRVRGEWRTL